MGTQILLPQRGAAPTQFPAHICCGQMAAWINVPLGMEVGLVPGDFVLDGNPARSLNFRPMFVIVIVISLEHCTSLLVCSSSSSSILCILLLEKKRLIVLSLSIRCSELFLGVQYARGVDFGVFVRHAFHFRRNFRPIHSCSKRRRCRPTPHV